MGSGIYISRGIGFDDQCYGEPRNWNDIRGEPSWQFCLTNQLGCEIPPTPLVDDTGSNDPIQSQTVWLKSTTPSGFDVGVVLSDAYGLSG